MCHWASCKILAYRVAITLEATPAVEALEEAFARYGLPDIVNTGQGSQFTAGAFKGSLASSWVCLVYNSCSRRSCGLVARNAGIHSGHNFIVRHTRPWVVDGFLNLGSQPSAIDCGFVRFAHGVCPAPVPGVLLLVGGVVFARVELAYRNADITQHIQRGQRVAKAARLGAAGLRQHGTGAAAGGDLNEERPAPPPQCHARQFQRAGFANSARSISPAINRAVFCSTSLGKF